MKNSDKFKRIYNKIDKYLRKQSDFQNRISFSSMIHGLSDENPTIRVYKDKLLQTAKLRNCIIHEDVENKPEAIAEPHDEIVSELEEIYERLTKPQTVMSIASKPVETCDVEDAIKDVIKTMRDNVYTHIPVYDNGKFVGIFSESSIARWIGNLVEKEGLITEDRKIGDLKDYFDKLEGKFSCFKFVSKNTDVFTVREEFLSFVKDKRRLGAIFVTENGNKNEKPLGIVTSWDLPKIKIPD